MISAQQIAFLLPLSCKWAEEQERVILRAGVALSDVQLADARNVGVIQPNRIRLMVVKRIPKIDHPTLRAAAIATQIITPFTDSLTLRYGIYITSHCRTNRQLIMHKFVHTA